MAHVSGSAVHRDPHIPLVPRVPSLIPLAIHMPAQLLLIHRCLPCPSAPPPQDDNPMLSMHPTDFTNDPPVIARNDRMAAVNAALAVDLTGQVWAVAEGLHTGRVVVRAGGAELLWHVDG